MAGQVRLEKVFVVMRADDNGNRVEVSRWTSRGEAESVAAAFEARGHKQTYWVEEDPAPEVRSRTVSRYG